MAGGRGQDWLGEGIQSSGRVEVEVEVDEEESVEDTVRHRVNLQRAYVAEYVDVPKGSR